MNLLIVESPSKAKTIEKYLHDVSELKIWLGERELCKSAVLEYKSYARFGA